MKLGILLILLAGCDGGTTLYRADAGVPCETVIIHEHSITLDAGMLDTGPPSDAGERCAHWIEIINGEPWDIECCRRDRATFCIDRR